MGSDLVSELDGLRALARSLVHGDAEAEDLIHDAAIAAITHPPATDRPVRPWLATVVRNRWRMNRRTDARRRAREHAVAPDEVVEAEDPIDRARAFERLGAALVSLAEPFKTCVIRRYLDGESAAEIARALGVPAGTVRWRLKTGLDRLRASLDATTPDWHRALVPLTVGKGALLVKTKALVFAAIVMLLVGAASLTLVHYRSGSPQEVSAIAAPPIGNVTPSGVRVPGTTAPPPKPAAPDPLPGQGRAIVERVEAAGGVLGGRVINWSTGDGVRDADLTFTADAGAVTVRSHEDGTFELAPAAPGGFTLTAVASPGFLPYAPELAHSSVHVELAAGRAVRGITVFLFPAVDYHGRVVNSHDQPVAGARVRLLGTPTGEQTIEKLATEWTSDKDGMFTFHAADDAVFEAVRGAARGWARLDGNVAITKQLVIKIGDEPPRDATIRGTIVGRDNAPIAEVLVRAEPEEGKSMVRSTAFATTGADGNFVLEGLDRGTYRLVAEAEGHAPILRDDVAAGTTNLRLVLDTGQQLAGTVVTTEGAEVPAYTLLVSRRRGMVRELVVARSIVDPRGRFSVHVDAGEYDVVAAATGWAPSAPTTVTAGTRDARIVVSIGATLRGKVVDSADAAPLGYARVMREASGGGATTQPANAGTVTRADGSFELTGIPPGPVSVTVAAGGYHPRVESGLVAADGGALGPLAVALTKLAEGEQPSLELVGIGCKLSAEGEGLSVEMVYPDSGAAAAGIVVGDLVVAVDGVPVTALGVEGAISRIRGTIGTTVSISVARAAGVVQIIVTRKKLRA